MTSPVDRRVAFRRQARFSAEYTPREIELLEQNVRTKIDEIDALSAVQFVPSSVRYTSLSRAQYWEIVRCDPTVAAFNLTLPEPFGDDCGPVVIKNESASANAVTACALSTFTIDGSATLALSGAWKTWTLYPDEVRKNWIVVGR